MAGIVVNGEQRPLEGVPLHTNALDFLRACGLTGAKEGCAEGECGACSVLVARPGIDAQTEWTAVNACLLPIASLDGQEIVTSEGLGTPADLHPVQEEMAVRGGSQCGFCTPGFICSMAAEFYRPGRTASTAEDHEPWGLGDAVDERGIVLDHRPPRVGRRSPEPGDRPRLVGRDLGRQPRGAVHAGAQHGLAGGIAHDDAQRTVQPGGLLQRGIQHPAGGGQ